MSDRIPVSVRLGGDAIPSSTRVVSAAAEVLVVSTTVTSPIAPVTLHSTYVGARGQETLATHLLLAPGEPDAKPAQRWHARHELPVADDERHPCLYDHLQQLLGSLVSAGHAPAIDVGDRAVELVDR